MIEKPTQPAEPAEIKKHIETIVGHEIDPGAERVIKFSLPLGSYAVLWMDEFGSSLLQAYLSGSRQGMFYSPTSRRSRRFIYRGGWQAGVSGERRCVPPGRNVWLCGTDQYRRHASCREPNLPHHDLLADTAGSGSIIQT